MPAGDAGLGGRSNEVVGYGHGGATQGIHGHGVSGPRHEELHGCYCKGGVEE